MQNTTKHFLVKATSVSSMAIGKQSKQAEPLASLVHSKALAGRGILIIRQNLFYKGGDSIIHGRRYSAQFRSF